MRVASDPRSWRRPWAVVVALGITQITSWGSIYYLFALLLTHLERDLGASKSAAVGAFSIALLISGLLAPIVGKRIDRAGGRLTMTAGSAIGVVGLVMLSRVHTIPQLYAAWAVLGVAMAATLYEPAFAVVTRLFAEGYRTAITVITLFGGFASTVFWPLAQALIDSMGWRDAVLYLGLINLVVCIPLHWFVLPGGASRKLETGIGTPTRTSLALHDVLRDPSFYLLCAAFTANALVLSAMAVHMLPMLGEKGLTPLQAAAVGAMVGPMQVAGRLVEMFFGRRYRAVHVGLVAVTMLPVSLVVFFLLGPVPLYFIGFAFLYGAGNGVTTIVRGIIPAELFGREHYGAVNGAMAAPVLLAKASGPFIAAVIWTLTGSYSSLALALAAIAAASTVFFLASMKVRPRT